jgi:hypothetical protein
LTPCFINLASNPIFFNFFQEMSMSKIFYAARKGGSRMRRLFMRSLSVLAVFAVCTTALVPNACAQQGGGLFEALYVFKFCSFVKFPADRASGDFVIAVVGAPEFAAQLEKTVAGKSVGTQPIKVKIIAEASEIGTAQMVYVPDAQSKKLPKILEAVRGKPTLVVSKGSGLAQAGSHINIFTNGDKKFEINRAAAESAGLKFSADLLKLAVVL